MIASAQGVIAPCRCRGSAMLETVLVLPLVFVVLGLVFFFEGAFEGRLHQQVLTRYEAAQRIHEAISAPPTSRLGLATEPGAMETLFFRDRSDVTDWSHQGWPSPAMTALAGQASATARLSQTGELARAIARRAPQGVRIVTRVDHQQAQRIHEAAQGDVAEAAVHPGASWAFADAMRQGPDGRWSYRVGSAPMRVDTTLRNTFYLEFDRQLDNYPQPQARLVSLIRGLLYAHQPAYVGPAVQFNQP